MPIRNVEYIIGLRDKFSSKMGNIQARTKSLDNTMMRLRGTIGTLFAAFAAQRVITDIIKVGSNFEQLQISFETMLGSAEKATKLIKDLTKFAIETPFELKDVAAGAKSLLAFGIANEKILPTLKSLGDVAAGLSVPIERLILNFGQVKAQTILTCRELRDFAIAGVPLLGELAKIMGKTTAEVKTLVSTGDVGFGVVDLAFRNMSEEGGKFFDLMKKQTKSTGGQISNLRDVVGLLENDLFKKFQPAINNTVVAIQKWIAIFRENIETVVNIISLVGQFIKILIIYKALQLSVNLIVKGAIIANRLYRLSLVLINRGLTSSIRLMRGFKLALARTGIGLALVALSELIIRFSGLEKIILRTTTAQEKFLEQQERLKALKEEIKSTKELFTIRRTLDQESLISLKERIGTELSGLKTLKETTLASLTAEKAGAKFRELKSKFDKADKLGKSVLISQLVQEEGKLKQLIKTRTGGLLNEKSILQDQLSIIEKLIKPTGAPGGVGGVNIKQVGITKITSAAPKIFNINIDSLIENFTISTTNLRDGTTAVKQQLTEAMLTMLADVQLRVR